MYNNIVGYFINCYVRVRPVLLLVDATIEVKLDKLTILNENAAITKLSSHLYIIYSVTNNLLSWSLIQMNIQTVNFSIHFIPSIN